MNPAKRPTPLYEQVDARIRERLVDGQWRPGMMIPSEQQLAAEFGVSQGTVRRAIDVLVSESVLTRRQGTGTFVAQLTERRALYLYFNFVGLDGSNAIPESDLLASETRRVHADEAPLLGLARTARVHAFERVRSLAGEPVLLETIVASADMFPGLGANALLPNHLFRHYEAKYGISVVRADERLSAIGATRMPQSTSASRAAPRCSRSSASRSHSTAGRSKSGAHVAIPRITAMSRSGAANASR